MRKTLVLLLVCLFIFSHVSDSSALPSGDSVAKSRTAEIPDITWTATPAGEDAWQYFGYEGEQDIPEGCVFIPTKFMTQIKQYLAEQSIEDDLPPGVHFKIELNCAGQTYFAGWCSRRSHCVILDRDSIFVN